MVYGVETTLDDEWLTGLEHLADVPEKEHLPFERQHHQALRTSATTSGRCRLQARNGCTMENCLLTSTWRGGVSMLDTWVYGLGPDQGGTCICSGAFSVADRRVGCRPHAVGSLSTRREAKTRPRLSCHSQDHFREPQQKVI
jgi:hypothetical protein